MKKPPPRLDDQRYATITRNRKIGYTIEFSFGPGGYLTYEFPAYRLTKWGAERKARRYVRKYDHKSEHKDTWRIK